MPEIREMMRENYDKENKRNSTIEYIQDNDSIFEWELG